MKGPGWRARLAVDNGSGGHLRTLKAGGKLIGSGI